MIRLGVCTGIENAQALGALGYDYIELGMSETAQLSPPQFDALRARVEAAPLGVEAMNGMIPARYPLCAPDCDWDAVKDYLALALDRAALLGVRVVVFGSGGARRVPAGVRLANAYARLIAYLRLAGEMAAARGICIAIEPLRAQECNVINFVAEAQYLAAQAGLQNVGALADLYHMAAGGEGFGGLSLGPLFHCHIAEPLARAYPRAGDGSQALYEGFFHKLHAMGYAGRISIEGSTQDLRVDAARAFPLLDRLRG